MFQTGQQARFDFHGNVIPADADVPVSQGLHHHGEEPQVSCQKLELSLHAVFTGLLSFQLCFESQSYYEELVCIVALVRGFNVKALQSKCN